MTNEARIVFGDDEKTREMISKANEFVCQYSGVSLEHHFFDLFKRGDFEGGVSVKDNVLSNEQLEKIVLRDAIGVLCHEIGETAYVFSHYSEIDENYCGLKKYYGEVVGEYFNQLYDKKHDVESEIEELEKYEKVSRKLKAKRRYRKAESYVKDLMEKPEREQVMEVQRIIFGKYPNTLSFKLKDMFYCVLGKIGMF